MTWSAYGSFLAFAVVLVLVPGPDFAVVTKNTLTGGRRGGWWSAVGVASSNATQGALAAAGLGAVIVPVEPLFGRSSSPASRICSSLERRLSDQPGAVTTPSNALTLTATTVVRCEAGDRDSCPTSPTRRCWRSIGRAATVHRRARRRLGAAAVRGKPCGALALYLLVLVAVLTRARRVLARRRVRRTWTSPPDRPWSGSAPDWQSSTRRPPQRRDAIRVSQRSIWAFHLPSKSR